MNQPSLLCSALLTVLTVTAVPDDNPIAGDLAKLQGKWTATVEIHGSKISWHYQIEGNSVRIRITTPEGQQVERKEEFKIDESAKPHKTIDWTKRIGQNGAERPDLPAIYAFDDDDTLKICLPTEGQGPAQAERPTEFGPDLATGKFGATVTLILTRVKETAKAAP